MNEASGTTTTHRITEVAERLCVSRRQVRNYIANGELEAVNVGAGTTRPAYRVTEAALAAFLTDRKVQP